MGKKKEVAVKDEAGVPTVAGMMDDADLGFDDVTQDDMQTPFLTLLQKGSPQVDDDNDDQPTIEGAKAGMFINSVTNELYDGEEGIQIIPCFYKRAFAQYGLRENGGGFMGEFSPDDPIINTTERDEKFRDVLPDGTQLVDTRTFHVLVIKPDGEFAMMILALTSTQIKKARRWMTTMRGLKFPNGDGGKFTPPMFGVIYRATSVPESNAKGNWRGWNISMDKVIDDAELYAAAKKFHELSQSGLVKPAEQAGGTQAESDDVPY